MKAVLVVLFAGLCLVSEATSVEAAAAPPAKIVITPASFSEREGLLVVTQNQGFFRKHKLDVQLVLMPSAPIAFSALTAGESHFYYGTTSGTSLSALFDGIAFIQSPDNKNAVLTSLVQWLRLSKTEDAVEGYEFIRKMYSKRIYPTVDGMRNAIRLLGTTNEKFRGLKAEDLIDDRIVRKLEKKGRFRMNLDVDKKNKRSAYLGERGQGEEP